MNPTRGPLIVCEADDGEGSVLFYDIKVVQDGMALHTLGQAHPNSYPQCRLPKVTLEEAKANADLWAEASNVLEETGRTPRQLVDRIACLVKEMDDVRDGLLRDLDEVRDAYKEERENG